MAAEVLCILDKALARAEIAPNYKIQKSGNTLATLFKKVPLRGPDSYRDRGLLAKDSRHRKLFHPDSYGN